MSTDLSGLPTRTDIQDTDHAVGYRTASAGGEARWTWATIKAWVRSWFAISDVPGLQTALDGKAAASHTHSASALTDFADAARSQVEAALVPGANVTITPAGSGATRTLTIAATPAGGSVASTDITDSTAAGRAILTAADAAAQKTALGLNHVDNTSDATKNAAAAVLENKTIRNAAEDVQTLVDGATVDWDHALGAAAKLTLGGNRTIANPTNVRDGATAVLEIIQDATGSRTVSWGSDFRWPGDTPPTLSVAASRRDLISFYVSGGKLYGTAVTNFA